MKLRIRTSVNRNFLLLASTKSSLFFSIFNISKMPLKHITMIGKKKLNKLLYTIEIKINIFHLNFNCKI